MSGESRLEAIVKKAKPEKKKDVKAMIISEFPVDSIMGTSEQANDARKGIIEYVKSENPDVIFVDGLVSYTRFPEAYGKNILESEPIKTFMKEPFCLASEFLQELRSAFQGKIYYVLSDSDEDNIRRLTKYTCNYRAKAVDELIRRYVKDIKTCEKEIHSLTKERKKLKEKNKTERRAEQLEKIENDIKHSRKMRQTYLYQLDKAEESQVDIPNSESIDYNRIKDEVYSQYINTLKELNDRVNINKGEFEGKINGYTFLYKHSFNMLSKTPLKSSTNRLLDYVNKLYIGNNQVPDFILEGGHNAETVAQVYRHDMKDKYSLIFSAPVMEDQTRIKDMFDRKYNPELFQGLQNRLMSCKRFAKKLVAPGISVVGRKPKGGYYAVVYSMNHLAKVGRQEIKILDMKYESMNILADPHIGKGDARYDKLKSAEARMEDEIDERKAKGESASLLFMVNESLQGRNYKTMPVETKRSIPEEFEETLKNAAANGESIENIIGRSVNEIERVNEPRLMNQLERYNIIINPLIMKTLLNSKYETAVVFTEGTHIKHTVGEFGITETELQTMSFKEFVHLYNILVKENKLPYDEKIASMYEKIKFSGADQSGYVKFEEMIGENIYKFSATHKDVSANPQTNIPMKVVQNLVTMRDDADIKIAGHHHIPSFTVIGRLESNDISVSIKGATFNEYDSYGKEGGWAPAVIGYVKGIIPTNAGGKGVYGVEFITSDIL